MEPGHLLLRAHWPGVFFGRFLWRHNYTKISTHFFFIPIYYTRFKYTCMWTHAHYNRQIFKHLSTNQLHTHIKCDNSIFILPVLNCVHCILLTTQMHLAPYSTSIEAFSAISDHWEVMYLRSDISGYFKTYWFSLHMYNKAVFASRLSSICNFYL